MHTFFLIAILIALVAALRWLFFVRIGIYRAPYCPVCGEARGRTIGLGERSGHRYLRCPHCSNQWEVEDEERE